MTANLGPGLHVATGRDVDSSAYDGYIGRWSRLFVPAVLAAAGVAPGYRVLDVSTGTGEAAVVAIPMVGASGLVIGADISSPMLERARARLNNPTFWPIAADGQGLPFRDGCFDAVVCQLGLQFFLNPLLGLIEFRRVLRPRSCAAVCVISTPDRAPMWGILADALSRFLPEQRNTLQLSFALADPRRLESLFASAGFTDILIQRETHEDTIESFDEYWTPIEAGTGIMPQLYLTLAEVDRSAVRGEVRTQLSKFVSNGRLRLSVEMLIGKGRA
jgi:ubiquinone/menaquinone biosynthesis C-methylase UbiE